MARFGASYGGISSWLGDPGLPLEFLHSAREYHSQGSTVALYKLSNKVLHYVLFTLFYRKRLRKRSFPAGPATFPALSSRKGKLASPPPRVRLLPVIPSY
jgi:hypothetical protein